MKKIFLIFIFFFISAPSLHAFEPKTGFHLGGFISLGFAPDDNQTDTTIIGGFGLEGGYDFEKHFDLLGRVSGSMLTRKASSDGIGAFYDFLTFDVGFRYIFKPDQFSPYLLGTIGFFNRNGDSDTDIESNGGFHASTGLGFLYHLTPGNALGLEGTYNYFGTDPSPVQFILFNITYTYTF